MDDLVAGLGVPRTRFAVRVVPHAPDPVSVPVETRILIDGGMLRAASEPREILLDENDGAELHVTIVREGAEVVWKDWHWDVGIKLPGEFRFDAEAYDREVADDVVTTSCTADPRTTSRWWGPTARPGPPTSASSTARPPAGTTDQV